MVPCQEDYKKEKPIDVKKDKDQASFHLFQDFSPPYPISYPPPKYDEDTTSTIFLELTENCEQSSMPILSKETFQDQIIPSCSTSPYSLQNCAQASNAPIRNVAHSKDVDIPFQYPFASPKSILGPYPSKLKPSNLPSILGSYVHSSPTFSIPSSSIIP